MPPRLYIALLHYPVYDRQGRVVTTAVTNLDIHDISRSARTYGAERFYIVTPLEKQKALVGKILRHWREGPGARFNPSRREAFSLTEVKGSLEEVIADISERDGCRPGLIATGAGYSRGAVGFGELRKRMASDGRSWLLVFGTGSGLAAEVTDRADFILEPLGPTGGYNHLSVRSAVAVVLDRLRYGKF
ncbi:MAG TPA: RNA methyltransferase [Syntrophales bacterium]|nr:RNA methyltransferase [Syntrophales bacterium]HOX94302.1 RNA methyltransferase [Syntrophales bacterium]HPI58392.1 RNA methyltransferase [Syntrophales bacterium]HPN26066.1 RNA methyltransferase [Syntrophales bacterium]HQM30403.1 RNA methyltransferase [Syntrophales bacterium]